MTVPQLNNDGSPRNNDGTRSRRLAAAGTSEESAAVAAGADQVGFNSISSSATTMDSDDALLSTILKPPTKTTTTTPSSSSTKTTILYGIRHGKSLSNEWMSKPENEWGSPTFNDRYNYHDSALSETGIQQAQKLAHELVGNLPPIDLVVVSPLTRCLQTYQYAVAPAVLHREIPVLALPLLAERVYTISETGRQRPILEKEFPKINFDLLLPHDNDNGIWWYNNNNNQQPQQEAEEVVVDWRPCDDNQYYAVPGEPQSVFERRMIALEQWFQQRPEKHILAVGHWGVFRQLTNGQMELHNCQVCKLEL